MQNIGFITLYSVSADVKISISHLVLKLVTLLYGNHNHTVKAVPSFCDFLRGK